MAQRLNVSDYQRAAKARLPRMVYEFVSGGAEDEVSLGANEADLRALRLLPRSLVDVAHVDTSTTLFGTTVPSPLVLGPAGLAGLLHAEAECEIARGAGRAGSIYTLSTGSSRSLEQVADAATGPLWFQLYLWKDRAVIASLVQRAKAAGYQALCLTVDVPAMGNRERDARNGMAIPPRLRPANVLDVARHPRWVSQVLLRSYITYGNLVDPSTQAPPGLRTTAQSLAGMFGRTGSDDNAMVKMGEYVDRKLNNPGSTWEDFTWLRQVWDGPLLVKGILSPEDARTAVRLGADGVVVSNHGGRQLDTAVSSIGALPRVVDAVGDDCVVLMDGGVRRGSDVAKALALGAQACLVARPYLYGLTVAGADGVEAVVSLLQRELARVLALSGCPDAQELSPAWLWNESSRGQ